MKIIQGINYLLSSKPCYRVHSISSGDCGMTENFYFTGKPLSQHEANCDVLEHTAKFLDVIALYLMLECSLMHSKVAFSILAKDHLLNSLQN